MMISFVFVIAFWSNLSLLSSLVSQLINIIICGLNQLLMCKTFLCHEFVRHSLCSVMHCARIYRKRMFYLIGDVAISRRRKILGWFNLHVVHQCSIFLLSLIFYNLFIIILSRALRRCIISNFQLLKLFLLPSIRFLQPSLLIRTFSHFQLICPLPLQSHHLRRLTQTITITNKTCCFWRFVFWLMAQLLGTIITYSVAILHGTMSANWTLHHVMILGRTCKFFVIVTNTDTIFKGAH